MFGKIREGGLCVYINTLHFHHYLTDKVQKRLRLYFHAFCCHS